MNPLLPESAQRDLVLASNSPRRAEILRRLEFDFDVVPAADGIEEGVVNEDSLERPLECAVLKSEDVATKRPDALCIGADTVVVHDGRLLGKPANDEAARRYLERLSGHTHTVISGLALRRLSSDTLLSGRERTEVTFRKLSDDEIDRYVACGEGRDKAGAYGIQGLGAALVASVSGCYFNVVGLPVSLLFDLLKKASK